MFCKQNLPLPGVPAHSHFFLAAVWQPPVWGCTLSKCDLYPPSCVYNFTLVPFHRSVDGETFKIAIKTCHDLSPPQFLLASHSPSANSLPPLLLSSLLSNMLGIGYFSTSGPLNLPISLLHQGEPAAPPKLTPHTSSSLHSDIT